MMEFIIKRNLFLSGGISRKEIMWLKLIKKKYREIETKEDQK